MSVLTNAKFVQDTLEYSEENTTADVVEDQFAVVAPHTKTTLLDIKTSKLEYVISVKQLKYEDNKRLGRPNHLYQLKL